MARSAAMNLLPTGYVRLNYIRRESAPAVDLYRNLTVHSDDPGMPRYQGSISLLHTDGNHDLDVVRKDCAFWLPFVKPGGWVILDDDRGAHGCGSQIAGDTLLGTRLAHFPPCRCVQ